MIEDLLANWRLWQEAQDLSERTISERAITVRAMLRMTGEDPLKITPMGIVRYTSQGHLSKASKASYQATVRAYCAWLLQSDQREDDPSLKTPRTRRAPGKPRPLTDEEVARVLDAVKTKRTLLMIQIALLSGLRVHEIAKIRGEDFDLGANTITVIGKGNKTETTAVQGLLARLAAQQPRTGYWFPSYVDNKHGKAGQTHIRSHAVAKAISDTMVRAGVKHPGDKRTPHSMRHWYATTLLSNDVPLAIVQKLMRHSSPATTVIYAQVQMPQQQAATNVLYLPGRRIVEAEAA
ncbi:site-specific integrase [Subtercola sp. PAMC28395]|uniref:tyrosine-type recombinase/integrase n=1 Tax=Subtercola sp. PAMC28395 TaxID=2846775 RepID=UPI001C0CB27C|nr:site-specific integrase [Subtercola sp. PAMC28395]QWT24926.1 site-specific integrase [Subtercola sp. PAMC28395]